MGNESLKLQQTIDNEELIKDKENLNRFLKKQNLQKFLTDCISNFTHDTDMDDNDVSYIIRRYNEFVLERAKQL